jgi:sodium-dependent phosphate cotransporter
MAEKFEEEPKSRKDRPTGSTHFGDTDFADENPEDIGDASWGEVFQACCVHTPAEWGWVFLGIFLVCFFLYFFLLGLNLLGSSAKVIGGCTAGALFGDQTNPVAGVMVGILATVLIQSSSSTTSIIVSLVPDVVSVKAGIFMVMGANIGTSVTNTIVAMGHLGDGDELERAFSAATVHDMFNFLSVGVLFPIELITHYLYYLTKAMLPDSVADGDKWEGPIKKIVSPLGAKIIAANKKVSKSIATGDLTCDELYPVVCEDGVVSKATCKVGLIACDKKTGLCPAFFQDGATRRDDEVAGGVCFFLALVILIICLIGLVTALQKMLLGLSTRIIYKATNINGYIAMLIGAGITVLVQSSSITTSALTPFAGIGAIQLEQMLPLTLGANIGTTVTGLLASLVSSSVKSLQVALCHLFFNISGILIWYPVPFMRQFPLNMARALGKTTRVWRGFPIVYIIIVFGLLPLTLFGVSTLFEQDSKGFTILGSFLVIIIVAVIGLTIYRWYKGDLKQNVLNSFETRQRKNIAINSLPDDMDTIKNEIAALKAHTGMPVDDEKDEEENA